MSDATQEEHGDDAQAHDAKADDSHGSDADDKQQGDSDEVRAVAARHGDPDALLSALP